MHKYKVTRQKPAKSVNREKIKLIIIFAAIALVAALAVIATIIISNMPTKINYDKSTDTYTVSGTDTKFYPVAGLEPISRGTETVARIVNGKYKTNLYAISGMDTSKWLCDEDGTVYRAGDDDTLETSSLTAEKIDICIDGKTVRSIAQIVDEDVIKTILDLFSELKTFSKDLLPTTSPDQSYTLRFTLDGDYEGLYYSIKYVEYPDDVHIYNENGDDVNCGKYIVCDDFNRRAMTIGTILHEYVD